MQHWEYTSIYLSAKTLQKPDEMISLPELANRLSQAIIEAVNRQKAEQWQMMNMEFNAGEVTIHFRRYVRVDNNKGR